MKLICTTAIEGLLTENKEYEGHVNKFNQLSVVCDDNYERIVSNMYFKEV